MAMILLWHFTKLTQLPNNITVATAELNMIGWVIIG